MSVPALTDSGLETWLVFVKGTELPHFASFPLLDSDSGRTLLADYFRAHLDVARRSGTDIVLETPTWRANRDWGERLGYDAAALDRVNRESVTFVREISSEFTDVMTTVSGNVGPRGDGYNPDEYLSSEAAEQYHRPQVESLAASGAERITMLTATHTGEAIGVVRAATAAGVPAVISFTVETDGRLPSGETLDKAIERVDDATGGSALYFGINCAHPDHFATELGSGKSAFARLGLMRANASRASHAELDEATKLDDGDPVEFAAAYASLLHEHPSLKVLGGCCGTDVRHIEAIAAACIV